MKRMIALLMAVALLFAFCGCAAKNDPDATEGASTADPATQSQAVTTPAPVDILDTLSSDQIYQLNTFLSIFAEQAFQAYPCSDQDLIQFGSTYALINRYQLLGMEGDEFYIAKTSMDAVMNRFFGISAPIPADSNKMRYSNDTYYFPIPGSQNYAYCSVATSMVDNGDGTYSVEFAVFAANEPHSDMSGYHSMTREQIAQCSELTYQYSGQAVIRDYTRSDGTESYHLISYSR